jgi:methanogenic corrinoid protein MtbC1
MANLLVNREMRIRRSLAAFRAPVTSELDRWRGALAVALCAGNVEHAQGIVADACEQIPAVGVLDDVLAPTMHHIGVLWEHNRITIADEHLATEICRALLAAIAPTLELAPPRSRERVLFATPTSEHHTTGLLMAKEVLYGAGYDTVMLTDGLSREELCDELRRYDPAIVGFSMTIPSAGEFGATLEMVHETLPRTHVITGGAARRAYPSSVPVHQIDRLDGMLERVDSLLAGQRA